MQKSDSRARYSYIFLFALLCFAIPSIAEANCSCTTGGGISQIGIEFIAASCPVEPPSDKHNYRYVTNNIECRSPKISYVAPWGDSSNTPEKLQSFWVSRGYRIFRNSSGTHMIAISPKFSGTLIGQGVTSGVTYIDDFNEYCSGGGGLADDDQDGYPNCADCAPADPDYGYNCLPDCTEQLQQLEEDCGGGDEKIFFNPETCEGMCNGNNQGPPECE